VWVWGVVCGCFVGFGRNPPVVPLPAFWKLNLPIREDAPSQIKRISLPPSGYLGEERGLVRTVGKEEPVRLIDFKLQSSRIRSKGKKGVISPRKDLQRRVSGSNALLSSWNPVSKGKRTGPAAPQNNNTQKQKGGAFYLIGTENPRSIFQFKKVNRKGVKEPLGTGVARLRRPLPRGAS